MTIAPNGVAIADYDPTGIGAIVLAGFALSDHPGGTIEIGTVVVAADVNLRPTTIIDHTADHSNNQISSLGSVLPGSWMCCGRIYASSANIVEYGSLWMRVA